MSDEEVVKNISVFILCDLACNIHCNIDNNDKVVCENVPLVNEETLF